MFSLYRFHILLVHARQMDAYIRCLMIAGGRARRVVLVTGTGRGKTENKELLVICNYHSVSFHITTSKHTVLAVCEKIRGKFVRASQQHQAVRRVVSSFTMNKRRETSEFRLSCSSLNIECATFPLTKCTEFKGK